MKVKRQPKLSWFFKPQKKVLKSKVKMKLSEAYTKYVAIDHILEDQKSNNSVENLNPVTPEENTRKSFRLNPGRKKGKGTIPIQGKKIDASEWVDYSGATEAAQKLNLIRRCITNVCRKKAIQHRGYVFRYAEDPDLKGEIWKFNHHVGIWVSNHGRVKTSTKTKGSLNRYYVIIYKQKIYLVHRLVCQTFKWDIVKHKFENQNEYSDLYLFWKSLEVNHKDTNKVNNHINNLEPLTKVEHNKVTDTNHKQSAKSRSIPILGKKVRDQKWILYSSTYEASRTLKVISRSSILYCLKGKIIKGYEFKYASDPDLDGEKWRDVPQSFFKHSVKGWKVSNKGRVKPKHGRKSPGSDAGKYKCFGRGILVHRAVAAAFMPEKIMEVLRKKNIEII